ncbi:MAG TPA: acyl-CoA dehydrogenase family protein [Vicinamibacterales bacterium]|jgi:acyl-CoA dehydrogenase|nr:acyl-CoA dehydrogenase family protein [Vicinamibacterales bacterium]
MTTLPFFDPEHADLAARLDAFARQSIEPLAAAAEREPPVAAGQRFVDVAAAEGILPIFTGDGASGPALRPLCLAREAIAACSAFADSVYAVQGLGTFPIVRFGDAGLRERYVDPAARGRAVAAFALTEPGAGSDAAAIRTTARRDGGGYVLDGTKTFISNAGLATFYVVFARTSAEAGSKGLSAFVVDADAAGFRVERQIELLAPHPIGELRFEACRIPAAQRLGAEGEGLKVALSTLDVFRSSVGAAACGMARRALDEAVRHASTRRQFGSALADFQATKLALADMATDLDAARLLVYRAAWVKDGGAARVTRESSMAKLFATEAAQRIIDAAVQIHGGVGVTRGAAVERLYREIRALRIYEGTSEIQRLVIADQVLRSAGGADSPGRSPGSEQP